MQVRNQAGLINVTQINDSINPEQNFQLFGLLMQNPNITEFNALEPYTADGATVTLSHNLKATDIKPFSTEQAYLVLNDRGEVVGHLHLLNIGMIYFQNLTELRSRVNTEKGVAYLQQLMNEILKENVKDAKYFKHPMARACNYVLEQLKTIDEKNTALLSEYYNFMYFYVNSLADSKKWTALRVKSKQLALPENSLARQFLTLAKDNNIFFADRPYYFKKRMIVFDATIVRRQRKNNKGEGFDILGKHSLGKGGSSSVYHVKHFYVEDQSKAALKHPYVYKISKTNELQAEFEATKELDHLAKSRNFHPGLFSMPYFGDALINYLENYLFKLRDEQFVPEMLRMTARIFEAAANQLKGKYHGDLKGENFCIDAKKNIHVVDFTKGQSMTPCNAAPEILCDEMCSLIKAFLAGHPHKHPHIKFEPLNFFIDEAECINLLDQETETVKAIYSLSALLDAENTAIFDEPLLESAKVRVIFDTQRKRDGRKPALPTGGLIYSYREGEALYVTDYSLLDLLKGVSCETEKSDVYSLARMMAEVWGDDHTLWTATNNFLYIYDNVAVGETQDLLEGLFEKVLASFSEKIFPRDILAQFKEALLKCHAHNPQERPSMVEAATLFKDISVKYQEVMQHVKTEERPVRLGL